MSKMIGLVYALLAFPTVSLLLTLCIWTWYQWRYRRIIAAARQLPTFLPTIPLLGNLHQSRKIYKSGTAVHLIRLGESGVARACLWFGPHPIIFLSTAEDVQAVICGSKTKKSSEISLTKFAFGDGIFIAPEDIHSITQRYINPILKSRNMQHLTPVFNESSRHFVQSLSEHVDRGEVNLSKHTEKPILNNITRLIFGTNIKANVDTEEFKGLSQLGREIGRILVNRFYTPWLWSEYIFKVLKRKEIDSVHQHWHRFADGPLKVLKSIENRHDKNDSNNTAWIRIPNTTGEAPNAMSLVDVLKTLQENHPRFTEDHLHHEMITLIVAERLYKEITSVLDSTTDDVTPQDIKSMTYLDQVFKETLRKFTVVPLLGREAKEDIKLSDFTIPAGTTVYVNLVGLHYNSVEFPEPHKFDPERFRPERIATMKRFTYIPFGTGSRICMGATYAELLVKTMVVHVLRRFRLTTLTDINNLNFKMGIALVLDKGYHIQLHRRI